MILTDILKKDDDKEIVTELNQLYLSIQNKNDLDNFYEMEDEELLINKIEKIENKQVLYSLWTVLCYLPPNLRLIRYCSDCIDQSRNEIAEQFDSWKFIYLLKNVPESREKLISKYLCSNDIDMKFAAIEALANTDTEKALHMMIDLYEFLEYEHDIIDSIELWLCNEGSEETILYLEEKMKSTENDIIRKWYATIKEEILRNL